MGIKDLDYVSSCCCTSDPSDGDPNGGICLSGMCCIGGVYPCGHYCNAFGCNCGFLDSGHCTHCSECVKTCYHAKALCKANRKKCWSSSELCSDYNTTLNRFKKFDLNADGAIRFLEVKSHFAIKQNTMDDTQLKNHFSKIDINKDGIIHPHEFDKDLKPADSKLMSINFN